MGTSIQVHASVQINQRSGFTLIEMAIVLTIIALIIGGILVGRNLIRAAQLNSVITDVGRYKQAVTDFHDKYLALPGDFAGATALWGSPSGGCPNGARAAGDLVTATCDGNGDGLISSFNISHGGGPQEFEGIHAWQHLSNAGMIDGQYDGIDIGGLTPSKDVPRTFINSCVQLVYYPTFRHIFKRISVELNIALQYRQLSPRR